MYKNTRRLKQAFALATIAVLTGCQPSDSSSKEQAVPTVPGAKPAPPMHHEMPSAQPAAPPAPIATAPSEAAMLDGTTLKLTGLTMTVPDGWVAKPAPSGPMAPKAVFSLPAAGGSAEPASVRITRFTKMKGMDEANIARWIGQARKPDGSPMTRADAKIDKKEIGNVHLTTVDIRGTIQATMRAAPKPGSRMIATIIDHPQGPHFVTIVGDEKTISQWEPSINSFLASVKLP